MKAIAGDHLLLIGAATRARNLLRRVNLSALEKGEATLITGACDALSAGLKARTGKPRNVSEPLPWNVSVTQ